ncbi:Uncharacterized protein conserved in archaea [Methanocella conradii HZ254]|uniref:UPF0146 protein Mtc_0516 n=2 Tax=Methanocella TaxID=570266 RepID=H8I585_METCZ|nr:Uncharacterized protein conserved in archaea [Methanocella conradii HZ254]
MASFIICMLMSIIGYEGIAAFIKGSYPLGSRIVEVGVGQHPEVAHLLQNDFDVICTDITESGPEGVRYVKDDIFKPDMALYKGASLIYSIRPPVDIQDAMASVAKKVGASLLIRPFSSERADLKKYFRSFKVINYQGAAFYVYNDGYRPCYPQPPSWQPP